MHLRLWQVKLIILYYWMKHSGSLVWNIPYNKEKAERNYSLYKRMTEGAGGLVHLPILAVLLSLTQATILWGRWNVLQLVNNGWLLLLIAVVNYFQVWLPLLICNAGVVLKFMKYQSCPDIVLEISTLSWNFGLFVKMFWNLPLLLYICFTCL